ncbi:dihydrofolate reductase [Pseudooceanicola sp. C21-150M6]|uniref:dihydrofolate reductase n=1 Tax=Pseudooceanicola sp. C21-150M6 TaxID=3434355 RepID=UPI003D8001C1
MITLVVARDRNGAIGRDNDIPWHLPGDMKLFQRETTGGAIVMGRRTWESLPVKPLKNRMNIVVSRDSDLTDHVVASVAEAVSVARAEGYFRIYGIGGASIYAEMLPLADRLLLTEVDLSVEGADTYFPQLEEADWQEVSAAAATAETGTGYVTRELLRRRS